METILRDIYYKVGDMDIDLLRRHGGHKQEEMKSTDMEMEPIETFRSTPSPNLDLSGRVLEHISPLFRCERSSPVI